MKILITGGLGHIGSKLIREIDRKHEVIVVDNLLTQRYCSLFNIGREITFINKGFEDIHHTDLNGVDVIIHLGAITDAASSMSNEDLVWDINVVKTKRFIDKVNKTNTKLFIFPSSTSVYGTSTEFVYEDDDSVINPQSPYANTKVEIENYIKECGIPYTILRFGTIFGKSIGMRFHTATNKFCYQASYGNPLTVWKDNFNQVRPYLGLNDAIQSINLVINDQGMWNQTYNVLTDNYSLKSIVEIIQRIKEVDIEFVNTPLLNQYSYSINFDKILNRGFTPKDNIEKEIIKTIKLLT